MPTVEVTETELAQLRASGCIGANRMQCDQLPTFKCPKPKVAPTTFASIATTATATLTCTVQQAFNFRKLILGGIVAGVTVTAIRVNGAPWEAITTDATSEMPGEAFGATAIVTLPMDSHIPAQGVVSIDITNHSAATVLISGALVGESDG